MTNKKWSFNKWLRKYRALCKDYYGQNIPEAKKYFKRPSNQFPELWDCYIEGMNINQAYKDIHFTKD